MDLDRKYRQRFSLLLLITHLVPLLAWVGTQELLKTFTGFTQEAINLYSMLAAITTSLAVGFIVYISIIRPLRNTYKGLSEIAAGKLDYTIESKTRGVFRPIIEILNRLSEQLRDVLSQTQTESRVIAAETNRLRTVLNSINDGVLALDKDRRIILYNKSAASITGFDLSTAAGQPLNRIFPAVKNNRFIISDWLDNLENSHSDIAEQSWDGLTMKDQDGKDHSINVYALYVGADPNGIRTLITFHDRTEAQELEDMKVDFVALAAHELRTPITIIRGYLEILEDELGSELSQEHQEFIRKLSVSSSQLAGTINNILHASRIEHGNLNLQLERVDWGKFVAETLEPLKEKAQTQGKEIVAEIAPKLPEVAVDRSSIVEVISNLVSNAIKYNKPKGTVTVTVREHNNQVETIVKDEGVGIPSSAMDKLFTKFYRSHRTRSSHQGTGLGLYMSKSIVEAHNGTIWVKSKEGQGSTFGFLLPKASDVAENLDSDDNGNKITRGVHGWIKNHSFYRG